MMHFIFGGVRLNNHTRIAKLHIKSDETLEHNNMIQQLARKNVPSINGIDATAVVFPPSFSIMATIVPQLELYYIND